MRVRPARAIAAFVAITLLVTAWLARQLGSARDDSAPANGQREPAALGARSATGAIDRSASEENEAAENDLVAMSETFRNTSLLIAIRAAGFICDDVTAAHQTGAGLWTVSCGDLMGYAVAVAVDGELVVSPVPHYFDAPLGPVPTLDPEQPLEPRRLFPR